MDPAGLDELLGREPRAYEEATRVCGSCDLEVCLSEFRADGRKLNKFGSICRACHEAATKARIRTNSRNKNLRKYGLTIKEFDRMLQNQGYACAVCRRKTCPVEGVLSVDHDHNTGEVRGLLCSHCNKGLGNFADDPEMLEAAAAYLRRSLVDHKAGE